MFPLSDTTFITMSNVNCNPSISKLKVLKVDFANKLTATQVYLNLRSLRSILQINSAMCVLTIKRIKRSILTSLNLVSRNRMFCGRVG